MSRLEDCENKLCPAGTWSSLVGVTSFETCEDRPCPAGTWSSRVGASSLEDCEDNTCLGAAYYCPAAASKPILVGDGFYSTPESASPRARTGQAACDPAMYEYCKQGVRSSTPPGYYVDANDEMLICPASHFCINSEKAPCPPGTACGVQSYTAFPCLPGTRSNSNQTECVPCKPGRMSATGASNCTTCPRGTFEQLRRECVACPAGRYGAANGLWNDTCSGNCSRGSYSARFGTECTLCEPGKHAPDPSADACTACDDLMGLTSQRGASACVCEAGKYRNADGVCIRCMKGVACADTIGNDIYSLEVFRGFWRADALSANVLECPVGEACAGGTNASSCAPGNQGLMCAVCAPEHYRPTAFRMCVACGSRGAAVASALGIGLGMVVALVIFIQLNRRAPNGLLRPFIDLVQKVTVMLLFHAPFPNSLVEMGKVLASLSLGLEVASPQCAGVGTDFFSMLGLTVVALITLILVMISPPLLTMHREAWSWHEMVLSKEAERSFRDLFVVVLLLHPPVSGKAMEFLP